MAMWVAFPVTAIANRQQWCVDSTSRDDSRIHRCPLSTHSRKPCSFLLNKKQIQMSVCLDLTGKLDNETEKSRENIPFISAFGLGYANIKSGYGLRWTVMLAMRWVFNSGD